MKPSQNKQRKHNGYIGRPESIYIFSLGGEMLNRTGRTKKKLPKFNIDTQE